MNKTKRLAPSLLAADYYNLKEDLTELEKADKDAWLHLDIMDGSFVPNISFGPGLVKKLREHVDLPFDVHLMIEHPHEYIPQFIESGADLITFHIETTDDVNKCLDLLDEGGIMKGLVLSPDTEVEEIKPYLDRIDVVLIMSVYPGFGGQKYIHRADDKLKKLKELIGDRDILIEVDGGINKDTIKEAADAGADVFVAGTAVFKGDIKENVDSLKEQLNLS